MSAGARASLCVVAALLAAAPAGANDSTAERAAGGLVLTRSDAIDMVSEELFVSATQIRVRYVFRNRTAADVRTTVAFPMPGEDLSERDGGDIALPHDFVTQVDGRPVRMARERKAVHGGKDHGALLQAMQVPLDDPDDRLRQLGKAEQAKLVALGLVQGADLTPHWTVQDTYHWDQLFPAGRDLVIEHRYVPGTGGSVGTILAMPEYRDTAEGRAYAARYCADAAFLSGVTRLARAAGEAYAAIPEQRVSYVLRTGANWRAPIGSFRLVVDKGAARNLVSFCGEGVRKISATQFEMVRKDWRPDRDLDVLIITPQG